MKAEDKLALWSFGVSICRYMYWYSEFLDTGKSASKLSLGFFLATIGGVYLVLYPFLKLYEWSKEK